MEDRGFSGAKLQTRHGWMEAGEPTKATFRAAEVKVLSCGCRTQPQRCDDVRSGAVRKKRKRIEMGRRIAQHSNRDKRHNWICSLWRNSEKRRPKAQRPGSSHPGVWRRTGPHESVSRSRSRTRRNNARGSDEWGRIGREASRGKERDNVRWKESWSCTRSRWWIAFS